jgi:hypothetical protein
MCLPLVLSDLIILSSIFVQVNTFLKLFSKFCMLTTAFRDGFISITTHIKIVNTFFIIFSYLTHNSSITFFFSTILRNNHKNSIPLLLEDHSMHLKKHQPNKNPAGALFHQSIEIIFSSLLLTLPVFSTVTC